MEKRIWAAAFASSAIADFTYHKLYRGVVQASEAVKENGLTYAEEADVAVESYRAMVHSDDAKYLLPPHGEEE